MNDQGRAREQFARRGDETVSPLAAGLKGRCPRCGEGKLFAGLLKIGERCRTCGLDFRPVDTGDGPAVFAILFLGFAVTFGALAVEILYTPPYWVHAVLWTPMIGIGALAVLRPLKGVLACLQYHHGAREARRDEPDDR